MGDDDNDIEMALACRHAFVPTVTSETMAATIRDFPDQITAIGNAEDTRSTEMALDELIKMLKSEEAANQ